MEQYKSLLQIYDERPDLQKAFPTKGTALDDWWNVHGVQEYQGTTLVQPGDPRLTQAPDQAITPASLAPVAPIDLTGASTDTVDKSALAVAQAEEQAKQDEATADTRVAEEEARKKEATEDITGMLTQLEGEGTEQSAAEQEAGIPGFVQEQADIQGQIAIKTAEYHRLEAQQEAMTTQLEGQPVSTGYIIGQKGQVAREFRSRKNMVASELELLQAQSLAISGKQAAAQSAVDRAIDLKYDALRLELNTKKFLLAAISEDLTKAEQKQWDYQQAEIARQEQEMEDQKAIDKQIQQIMLSLAGIAPNDVLAQISAAGSVLEAVSIASPYLVEEEEAPTYAPTSAMKEYDLARSQGYKGTFEDWQGGDADITDESLTASQVRDIKYYPEPPKWFSDRWEKKLNWKVPEVYPKRIQEEWDKLRTEEVSVDKEETVWAWLSTPEAQALSDEEKRTFIMGYGLNPDKFNIY